MILLGGLRPSVGDKPRKDLEESWTATEKENEKASL